MKKQPRKTKINSKKSSKNDFNNTTNNNMKQETTTRRKVTNACKNCQIRKVKCTGNTTCQRCQRLKLCCEFLVPQKKRGPPKGRPLTHKRKVKKVVNKIVVCEKLNFRVGLSNKTSSENTQSINLNVNLNINVNADDLNNGMRDDGNDEVNNDRIVEDPKDDNLIITSSNNFLQNNSYGNNNDNNNNNNNNIVISNHDQYFANEILTSPLITSGSTRSTPMTTTRSFIKSSSSPSSSSSSSSSPSSSLSSSSSSISSPASTMLPTPMLIDTQFINYSISPTLMPTMPPVPIIDKSYLENLAMEENNRLTSGSDSYNGNTFHELLNTHPPYVYDESSYIGNYYTAATMQYNNNNNMLEPNTYNVFNNYQYNNPLIVPSPSPNMFRDIFWRINSGDASSFLYNNEF